jgi:hypothetical protein
LAKPYTLRVLPIRANDRVLKDDPKAQKSNTESDEPISVIPYTEAVEPNLAKLRSDKEDPSVRKSKTLTELPRFDIPNILRDEPNFINDLMLIVEPT